MKPPTSVYGIYIENAKILLVKDAHSNIWGFPGGGMEDGEDELGTLQREVLEETGLSFRAAERLTEALQTDGKTRLFYRIHELTDDLAANGNGDDISEARFFHISELGHHQLADGVLKLVRQHIMANESPSQP